MPTASCNAGFTSAECKFIHDADSFYLFFTENCRFRNETDGIYTRYQVDPQLGEGYMEQIRLENGLELCITSLQLKRSISLRYHLKNAPLEMHYMLEGNLFHYEKTAGDMNLSGGNLSVFFRTEMEGVMTFVEGRKIEFVTVMVSDQLLELFLGESQYTKSMKTYRTSQLFFDLMKPHIPTAEVKAVFGQILSCPFTNIGKSIFFQGKAAELVAYILEKAALNKKNAEYLLLYPYEKEALEKAKEIMENNLATPPGIDEIANVVGLNVLKFKKGFKQLFQFTPHQYLIRCRMIRARELLKEKGYSVTEAALEVGYTNVSYFSRIFREYYGQTPKHFRFGL